MNIFLIRKDDIYLLDPNKSDFLVEQHGIQEREARPHRRERRRPGPVQRLGCCPGRKQGWRETERKIET